MNLGTKSNKVCEVKPNIGIVCQILLWTIVFSIVVGLVVMGVSRLLNTGDLIQDSAGIRWQTSPLLRLFCLSFCVAVTLGALLLILVSTQEDSVGTEVSRQDRQSKVDDRFAAKLLVVFVIVSWPLFFIFQPVLGGATAYLTLNQTGIVLPSGEMIPWPQISKVRIITREEGTQMVQAGYKRTGLTVDLLILGKKGTLRQSDDRKLQACMVMSDNSSNWEAWLNGIKRFAPEVSARYEYVKRTRYSNTEDVSKSEGCYPPAAQ